jgi:hypothetical protein
MPPNELAARRPFFWGGPKSRRFCSSDQQSVSKIDRTEIRALFIALTERKFTGVDQ